MYDYPETQQAGFTFWNCPACGTEDRVHVSPAVDSIFSEEELTELERKKNTFCSIKVVYCGISDIPNFKRFRPEFREFGNRYLVKRLSDDGGLVQENVSLLEAERIKVLAESCGLLVEINTSQVH